MHSVRVLASRSAALAAARAGVPSRAMHASPAIQALKAMALPSMSPTMEVGGIAQWKKKPGESFSAGDVLLEIETDKATMDVEAQEDGILAKIVIGDGAKDIKVGSVIAVLGEEGDDLSGADKVAEEAAAGQSSGSSSSPPAEKKKEDSKPAPKKEESESQPKSESSKESDSAKSSSASSSAASDKPVSDEPIERVLASPLAKRLAQERGIPLLKVKGTGPNGRITKEDIEKYSPEASAGASSGSSSGASSSAPASAPTAAAYTDVPTSSMRRVIAQRLTESKQQLPHYYVSIDVEMDRVLALRELFNSAAEAKAGKDAAKAKASKLSVGDFITKAAAVALREVPEVNAAWHGEFIRQYSKADISIAVATPTGLITPIVRDVGGNGLAAISAATKELAARARDGKLKPEEYQGGTFTISNMGMFGVSAPASGRHLGHWRDGGQDPACEGGRASCCCRGAR